MLTGDKGHEVFMAAAQFGSGRVVIYSHSQHVKAFTDSDPKRKEINDNIAHWVLNSRNSSRRTINTVSLDHERHDFDSAVKG